MRKSNAGLRCRFRRIAHGTKQALTKATHVRSTGTVYRRDFLCLAIAAPAVMTAAVGRAQSAVTVSLRLTLNGEQPGPEIPADFTGLSYESAALSDPSIFAPDNIELIGFFRRLGKAGVLRIGGNTSDYSLWSPSGVLANIPPPAGPDPGRRPPPRRPITPLAIRNLRGFLAATGWRLIYGLNLGTGTLGTAVDEAAYVAGEMGPKLVAFQLGNEPDLFNRNGLRKYDYNFAQYMSEWLRYASAIRARVPKAPFGGPDTAYTSNWLPEFAKHAGGEVQLLTRHFYALGPPDDPSSSIEHLLAPHNARFRGLLGGMRAAQQAAPDVPFRLTETNSVYGGGKAGVSDTFASALWGIDLMYRMAWAGAAGINFHGGRYGWYTPIAGIRTAGYAARPLYYGMLMFAEAGTGQLVLATLGNGAAAPLFSAYALKNSDGSVKVVLINKHANLDVSVIVAATNGAHVERLLAPRLDDTRNSTFAGARVGIAGAWLPNSAEFVHSHNRAAAIPLPRASAALVTLQ